MIIVCPHCQTAYEVGDMAVGAAGRQVQCANCQEAWLATAVAPSPPPARKPPEPVPAKTKKDDVLFDGEDEASLDIAFAKEDVAANGPADFQAVDDDPSSPGDGLRAGAEMMRQKKKAMDKRQRRLFANLPLARVRRLARTAAIAGLGLMLAGGLFGRTELVRYFPDLAGLYQSVGLAVNVVGLEFTDVRTLRALENGDDVMQVDARIYSVAARPVPVPPVVISLADAAGKTLYQWSVVSQAQVLGPGEVMDFSTRLTGPPAAARKVRMTFGTGRVRASTHENEDNRSHGAR